jgi:hypothetical protein
MKPSSLINTAAAVAIALTSTTIACSRKQNAAPELQTIKSEAHNEPVTVSGCLRAGLAENTFVLTSINANGSTIDPTTTYRLVGNKVPLADYSGQNVEVTGTVRAEQEVSSRGVAEQQKAAKGTSGTPTVETATELDVKQLDVDSVKPSGDRCAPAAPKGDQPPKRIK